MTRTRSVAATLAALLFVVPTLSIAQDAPKDAAKPAPAATDAAKPATPEKKKWDVNNPPGEKATVKLDTKTGTWMTVDVSPDGKRIVFDLLGDLYLLPIEGGDAKPLTSSIAWEMQARFSPDGKRITFMSDAGGGDNVWVMELDKSGDGKNAREVSKEPFRLLNNPVWHPNGQYIAARKHYTGTRSAGSGEIWLFHVSGAADGGGVQLNEKPNWQKDLGEPAFSPDGRYLYYSQDTTPGTTFEYNKNSNTQIYVIQRRDLQRGKTEAFVTGPGGAVRPTPSPDGKWLAFVRRVREQSTLFLKNLATGEEKPVWSGLERDMQEAWAMHGVYPAFAWMPGSKEIVVWAQGRIWRLDLFSGADGKAKAKEIPFRVQHTREVRAPIRFEQTVAPESFNVHQLRWVNVSPTGDKVVYSALGQLYVKPLGASAGEAKRLTTQNEHFEFFPRFSRDGTKLVYTTWNDQKLGSVRVLDLKTNKETVVTREPGKYLQPVFSPDGSKVLYVKQRGGFLTSPWHGLENGVFAVAADAKTAPKLLTEDGLWPQFGKSNDEFYLTRTRMTGEVDREITLVRLKVDMSEEPQIIAKGDQTSDFAIAPNGEWLAFRERYRTYVMPLPLAGRAMTIGPKAKTLPLKGLDVNAGDWLHWSGDSSAVHFALGDELFSRPLKDTFDWLPDAAKPSPKLSENGVKIGFTAKADAPTATVVISGARIVTMKGDEVIENGRIVVKGSRIFAVGRAADIAVPPGATLIDATGKTIIPGLIDAHWHGGMSEAGIIPQQSWINYASLAFGVTAMHDPSNDTPSIFTQSELQRAGKVVGPRIYSTGQVMYGAKSPGTAEINSLDDALTHLKRLKAAGAISVKSYNQPRRDQRQQVLEAARQTRMMVTPEGGSLFQHNMTMIIDGHTTVEHAIPVAKSYDDVKQLWAQTRVAYTPTLGVAYGGLDGEHYWYARTDVWRHPLLSKYVPRTTLWNRSVRRPTAPDEDFNILRVASNAVDLQRSGVLVNIGAHGQREGLAAHWEMWTLGKGGATSLEAIRAATLNPARSLGLDKDIGSLEPGKLADLVIIAGDVLKDIEQSDRITHVMQNGRVYDVATMNEVGATPKSRKPFFFEQAHAAGTKTAGSGATDFVQIPGLPTDMSETFHQGCGCH